MDLVSHESELQAVTAPPLTSAILKPPQNALSLSQPAVSSPAVPWQWLLTMEILQLHTLKPSLPRLPYRTHCQLKPKLCYDRRSVGQSVLELSSHLGLKTRSLLLSDGYRLVDVGRSL
jgi:hypothetical protein